MLCIKQPTCGEKNAFFCIGALLTYLGMCENFNCLAIAYLEKKPWWQTSKRTDSVVLVLET